MKVDLLKKLRRFCPHPERQIPASFRAFSMPLLASILIAEVLLLLVAPIVYSALLLPKALSQPPYQANTFTTNTLPLTNSQIKAAWPNLPTAQEVIKSGLDYDAMTAGSPAFTQVENNTSFWIIDVGTTNSPPPQGAWIGYSIWLKLNSTEWVLVPYQYLSTNNPPYPQYIQSQSKGFLGAGLPATYIIGAIVVIAGSSIACTIYTLHKKGKFFKTTGESHGSAQES